MNDKHADPWERIARFEEHVERLEAEIEDYRKALAVFADPMSWVNDMRREPYVLSWNKMGDFADPREFARLALEGE